MLKLYRWNHVAVDVVGLFQILGIFHFTCIYVYFVERIIYIHSHIIYLHKENKIYENLFSLTWWERVRESINIKMEYVRCMLNGLKQPFVKKNVVFDLAFIWEDRTTTTKLPKMLNVYFRLFFFSSTEMNAFILNFEFETIHFCIWLFVVWMTKASMNTEWVQHTKPFSIRWRRLQRQRIIHTNCKILRICDHV